MFALTSIYRLDSQRTSSVCNLVKLLVKLGVSSISIYSDIRFKANMFISYFSMCYLFLFDIEAKIIKEVIRGNSFFLVLREVDCIEFFS